ncbi:FHA domain-containing protein [Actinospica sp. MGRD01-02]|uniref:FHA domain-containing protein n=1 Tax=Actinospica acidithermotolerans TaxID=2828514 RepID=A0A941IIN8_9ACTN|nr:FtsK/SpoIIIE domain-containing protein [Actinospica acidithermotolerans]MBR7828539.1 FHA domain-containing protein [Actinospica acidithermotolerans]
MKLKITLRRDSEPDVDLLVTLEAGAKVADLAAALAVGENRAGKRTAPTTPDDAGPYLQVVSPHPVALDPEATVAGSGLRSGTTVRLVAGRPPSARGSGPTVLLRVTAGPDLGRQFRLPRGTAFIGRDATCAVRLADDLASRRHARITVGEQVEISDLGSTNGLEIGSGTVARALLRVGDTVRIGDTELRLEQADPSDAHSAATGESAGFNRPPRLNPTYLGETFAAPKPPAPAKTARIPIIPLFTPLLLGAVLYLTTHSITSLVFVGLSPLMALGYAWESARSSRRDYRREAAQFRTALAELTENVHVAAAREEQVRRAEHPSVADCVEAARHGTPLLWARRPGGPGFGEFRLGTATQPSRSTIESSAEQNGSPELLAELGRALSSLTTVTAVPLVAAPAEHGAIGLAGLRQSTLGVARGLVIQGAALHSPSEMLITAFASARTSADWDWLKWLPHTTPSPRLPGHRLVASAGDALSLLTALETELAQRSANKDSASTAPLILVIVEDDTPAERSRLVAIAEQGREHGIFVLWIADRADRLPAACRVFATVDGDRGSVAFAESGEHVDPVAYEPLDAATAADLAMRLAPLTDAAARTDDASDLPRSVPLIALGEQQASVTSAAILERWSQSRSILTGHYAPPTADGLRRPGTLRAVIGTSAGGAHALDLRADGPHALVGGTTGSGKSELLQSWILAMAAAHSPQRLTFLLVDYKGGSAFGDLDRLPHTVGLVTDLDKHLVRRCLASLSAELHRREEHFARHRAKDLLELESRGHSDAPPSLVIVVDEFAALVKELPEFVDGVINVAQRGRSLGVHLILATQRPAGVISDNLRANTNLRLGLRMADEADSLDVLGSREAAYFDQDVPGRAVSKTGPGRLVPFQVGYAGGWTRSRPTPQIGIEPLRFGAGEAWRRQAEESFADPGPTDLQRMVEAINAANTEAALPAPARPWLDELRRVYDLADRSRFPLTGRPNTLVFALGDEPGKQKQPTVAFRPDDDGNLAVYGTGGSGKSTLLRTIAAAAARGAAIDPTHVYGLDFASRGLAMLAELPHVGNVIGAGDHELAARLLRWLREVVGERAIRYAKAEVSSITAYRQKVGEHAAGEPRILLFVDGMAAFRQAYESNDRDGVFENFTAIAAAGRPVGVHVLVTADRAAAVPHAIASSIQTRLVMRLADPNEYAMLGAPTDVLKPDSPPGRGLLHGMELQTAVLGGSDDVSIQANYTRRLANSMVKAGITAAPAIEGVPERIPLATLPADVNGMPVIGLRVTDLQPQTFTPSGSFIVTGAPGSGRTGTLRTLARALRRWDPEIELHFFAPRPSELSRLTLWSTCADSIESAKQMAEKLLQERAPDPVRRAALFIECFPEFATAESALTELARAFVHERRLVVGETESSAPAGSPNGLQGPIKSGRTGLALAPLQTDGFTHFRTGFNRIDPTDFPPGRALFVAGGRTTAVQLAWTDA